MTREIELDVIKVKQEIGEYYIASISAENLLDLSYIDRARLKQENTTDIASYLGIQRELKHKRVADIADYLINNPDSTFPTSILLSVTQDCCALKEENNRYTLILKELSDEELNERKNTGYDFGQKDFFKFDGIAKILDGQHRLAGLEYARKLAKERNNIELLEKLNKFELNVSIFVGYDLHSQAMLFSTVNLAQTKVNKSIVYNMEEYSKTRSPQKSCHEIAKILDAKEGSPFYHYIKMLGCKTYGRDEMEPLTQATFVESLLSLISKDPELERNLNKKNKQLQYNEDDTKKYILHELYVNNKDIEISMILWNYFKAIEKRWETAWNNPNTYLISKNNCFRAFIRYLRDLYPKIDKDKNGIPSIQDFAAILNEYKINDEDFNVENKIFHRGDSGMNTFYKYLSNKISYEDLKQLN